MALNKKLYAENDTLCKQLDLKNQEICELNNRLNPNNFKKITFENEAKKFIDRLNFFKSKTTPEQNINNNDLENMPHDIFDIYDVPKTQKENQEYIKKLVQDSDAILYLLDARDVLYFLDKNISKIPY